MTIHINRSDLRPSDTDAALTWLQHGAELARDLKGDRAKHSDAIWQLIVESVECIDKTPDQERRWLTSGQRTGWKSPGLSQAELIDLETVRHHSGMQPFDGQTRCLPRRDDERALGVMAWLRWCNTAKSGDRLRKAAVALARSGDNEIAARIYAPARRSRHSQIALEIRSGAVGLIMAGLRDHLGIIPGDGISFRSQGRG